MTGAKKPVNHLYQNLIYQIEHLISQIRNNILGKNKEMEVRNLFGIKKINQ